MEWMKLKYLQDEANRIGRPICAWTPTLLANAPPYNDPEREYVLDKEGKPADGSYPREGMVSTKHSVVVVFQPKFDVPRPKEQAPRIVEMSRWDDRRKEPALFKFRTLTLDEMKNLSYRDEVWFEDKYGKARKTRVNGKPKTWKRTPWKVVVPMKYGLRETYYISERELGEIFFEVPEEVDEWPKHRDPVDNG